MFGSETALLLLTLAAMSVSILLMLHESWRWVAFYEAPGHRPAALFDVARELRRAGIRSRIKNTVTVGSESAVGAGVSTTLLVLKRDLEKARRATTEVRAARQAR